MPSSEEIKDRFHTLYDMDFIEVFNEIKDSGLIKDDPTGEIGFDFVEFILHNIDINKFVTNKK
mgnify:CR=1 FL=1